MGELLTRLFVWIAMLGYSVAFVLGSKRTNATWARAAWVGGAVAFVIHVACAFHFYHNWSHSAAFTETARQTLEMTGFESGSGLYLNYAFTLIWAVDATWWVTVGHDRYRQRSTRITLLLHGFFLFMIVNGAIVFGKGPVRWYGGLLVAMMIAVCAGRLRRSSG